MKISLLCFLGFLALASAQGDTCDGINLWTMSEVSAHSRSTACLVVIYDIVYDLKEFADIHRGGSWSITRNCGTDATFGYESLACIPGVPDHTRGVLNMVSDVAVGVIKDSPEDPCGAQGLNYPPEYASPDFDSCGVYDVVTCESLDTMPNGGKWTMDQVNASSTGCIVKLFDYVYDVGSPPQTSNPFTPPNSGSLTFAEKHGGGSNAVLRQCKTDMTEIFEGLVNKRKIPDHTKGALNAILPYLVGVIDDSPSDPCRIPPPLVCIPGEISYWSMSQVASATMGCIAVVLGKVYDLADFAQHHYGGRGEIIDSCGVDITNDFLEKSFHSLAQLGAIQQFQVGVIQNSMADPCSSNYIANPDPVFGDDGTSGGDDSSGESDDSNGEATRAPVSKSTASPTRVPTRAPVSEPTSNPTHAPTSAPAPGEDDNDNNSFFSFFNWCFPGEALVDVQHKGLVALKNLKIGDHILVDNEGPRYEPVYSFGHKNIDVLGDYLRLTTDSGAHVEISKEHLIFINEKEAVPASLINPGDKLLVLGDWETVKSITSVKRQGALAPFTPSGTIVVNGIKASTFVALQDSPSLIIGTFSTGLSFHWLGRTFELPRSLWCTHVLSCAHEEYTANGISTWVEGPYKAALWFLEQNNVMMAIAAVPLLVWLGFLSVLEWIGTQGLKIGGFMLALVTFYAFLVRLTTTIPHVGKKCV